MVSRSTRYGSHTLLVTLDVDRTGNVSPTIIEGTPTNLRVKGQDRCPIRSWRSPPACDPAGAEGSSGLPFVL